MKKIFALILMVMIMASLTAANAEDLGVQIIGGPNMNNNEPLSFDDIKMEKKYKIDGYATVTPISFEFVNMFAQWNDGQAGSATTNNYRDSSVVYIENPSDGNWHYYLKNCGFRESGNEADFAWLKIDVLNLKKIDASYLGEITVKVVYDEEYEYGGWVRQFYFDYNNTEIFRYNYQTAIGWPACMGTADEKPIGMMYSGHYVCGCTLPNFVIADKSAPLRMIINIGGNELTYNIRK